MANEKDIVTDAAVVAVLTPAQKKSRDAAADQCLAALHKFADTFGPEFGDTERCQGDGVTSILNKFWSERSQ